MTRSIPIDPPRRDPLPTWEHERRIPIPIRDRVWGGEGHGPWPAVNAPRTPRADANLPGDLLATLLRLRAAQRAQGTVYRGADHGHITRTDQDRTRRVWPAARAPELPGEG